MYRIPQWLLGLSAATLLFPACAEDPASPGDGDVSQSDTQGGPQNDAQGGDDTAQLGPEIAYLLSDKARDTAPTVSEADQADFQAGRLDFALKLYDSLAEDDDNIFYSPYSISTALAMTYAGAKGETAQQLADALEFHLDDATLHQNFNAIDLSLNSRELRPTEDGQPFTLELTNALFGLEDYPYLDAFLDLLAQYYGAPLYLADFLTDPEGSRQLINAWVKAQTHGLIPELLPQDSIKELTRLVLVNAIYFKANWAYPFSEHGTQPAPFYNLDGTESEVQMMVSDALKAQYAERDGVELLRLPYVGHDVVMDILLLPPSTGAAPHRMTMDAELLALLTQELNHQAGTLKMPRFELESKAPLSDILKSYGMELPFQEGLADFSGIAELEKLHISQIFHQAVVKVDEKGTEAAAATAVVIDTESAPMESFHVELNRPFIFMIKDLPTDTLLFVGRVAKL